MSLYRVNFGEYSLLHSTNETYYNYFDFNGKKYTIGAFVRLTEKGYRELYRNAGYNFIKSDVRLADYCTDLNGKKSWTYIIGWYTYPDGSKRPVLHSTTLEPEIIVSEVFRSPINELTYSPGELKVEFKEPNYNPSDCDVEGVVFGWVVFFVIWIGAFVFKDWWIVLLIQISAGWYFGNWRENKINEAIRKQKFKE